MVKALEIHMPRTGAAKVLVPRQVDLPDPAFGEVRVSLEAVGVAYADIAMRRGLYPGVKAPVTLGYDFVGRIEQLGDGVRNFSLGQRVAAVTVTGSYVTHRNVAADLLVEAPEHADPAQLAAATLNGLTSWQMFHRLTNSEPEEWVLIHGAAGGVGTMLLQLARIAGVRTVGTASPGKHAVVTALGGVPLDYRSGDLVKTIRSISGGGAVAAFDHIGGKHFRRVSLPSLRQGGIGVLYGAYDISRGGRMNPGAVLDFLLNSGISGSRLMGRGQGAMGYMATAYIDERRAVYRRDLAAVLALVGSGELIPEIGATYSLEEAALAHEALEQRAVSGKIVLLPSR